MGSRLGCGLCSGSWDGFGLMVSSAPGVLAHWEGAGRLSVSHLARFGFIVILGSCSGEGCRAMYRGRASCEGSLGCTYSPLHCTGSGLGQRWGHWAGVCGTPAGLRQYQGQWGGPAHLAGKPQHSTPKRFKVLAEAPRPIRQVVGCRGWGSPLPQTVHLASVCLNQPPDGLGRLGRAEMAHRMTRNGNQLPWG